MERILSPFLSVQREEFRKKTASSKKIHLPGSFGTRSLFPSGFLLPHSGTLFLPPGSLFRPSRRDAFRSPVLRLGPSYRLIKIRDVIDSKGHLRLPKDGPFIYYAVWLSFIP